MKPYQFSKQVQLPKDYIKTTKSHRTFVDVAGHWLSIQDLAPECWKESLYTVVCL